MKRSMRRRLTIMCAVLAARVLHVHGIAYDSTLYRECHLVRAEDAQRRFQRVKPTTLAGFTRATHGRSNRAMDGKCWCPSKILDLVPSG
jgi:hypothetical protein